MEWWLILLICIGIFLIWMVLSTILYEKMFKRIYDFILSLLALLVLSPIFIILIIVGCMAMRGNPFFTQIRPGKISKKTGKEKNFLLIKFRTMSNLKNEKGELLPDDIRLNKYGRFLRKTSLDELPELFNILIGNMSIIGPRPQLVIDALFMSDEQRKRHSIRPGLSGLAQIKGRNSISWEQKLQYDLEYLKHISLFGDIKIIILTVLKVLKSSDVNRAGTSSDMNFGDYLLFEGKISKEYYDETINRGRH